MSDESVEVRIARLEEQIKHGFSHLESLLKEKNVQFYERLEVLESAFNDFRKVTNESIQRAGKRLGDLETVEHKRSGAKAVLVTSGAFGGSLLGLLLSELVKRWFG